MDSLQGTGRRLVVVLDHLLVVLGPPHDPPASGGGIALPQYLVTVGGLHDRLEARNHFVREIGRVDDQPQLGVQMQRPLIEIQLVRLGGKR